MTKVLLVVGDDKLGRLLIQRLPPEWHTSIVLDQSSSLARAIKLIRRGSLSWRLCMRMAWADFLRSNPKVPAALPAVTTNRGLRDLIDQTGTRTVLLFRAGLIINPIVLESGAELLNIHCARVPAYGGLGSISRALADKAHDQVATLHRVTQRIDEGEVIDTEPYVLSPQRSYRHNEDTAYEAGIRLLIRRLAMNSTERLAS